MTGSVKIGNREIGPGNDVYVIAELSGNHSQSLDQAIGLVRAAKEAGADAVKLQTYTADTITLRSNREEFRIGGGTLWDGRNLHDLYGEAYTPWDWHRELKKLANELGLDLFSSPFDDSAVDFLETINVPAYKLASFELVDLGLIQKMARTGKPLIISTGMATLEEIQEALQVAREAGATQIALLKCTSAYPSSPDEMNLRTIPELARRFQVPVGLSDHTMGVEVPIAAVALGACVVEKHLTLSRANKTPDSDFSLEPLEFKAMVDSVRATERALGKIHFGVTAQESKSRIFRRSLFVVEEMKRGDAFTPMNLRSIRPGHGMHTRYLSEILGKHAACDIEPGTPMSWDLVLEKKLDSVSTHMLPQ
jgi:pseudaminic acid synthase